MVDGDGMHGAFLTTPYTWPAGSLVGTAEDRFDLRDELKMPLTLVSFGCSRWPDISQAVTADLGSAVARLEDGEADDVDVWFVTTDPARDDPATLREYLDRFDPAFTGLSGPLDESVEFAGSVHVPVEKGERLPSGGDEVTHGTPILSEGIPTIKEGT